MRISLRIFPLVGGAALLSGCNEYPIFRVTGFEQAAFNNNADILFIVDNSGSMRENGSQLALNFDTFLAQLTSAKGSEVPRETLNDAVTNYLRETGSGTAIIDYQLGITTTSADYSGGDNPGVDPGEAGLLLGDPPVITRGDSDVGGTFQRSLLCDTIYWNDLDLPSDSTYPVGDDSCPPPDGAVSREYLTCMCPEGWSDNEGAGNEEGLEAALDALCRAAPEPPEECWDGGAADDDGLPIVEGDIGSNDGFIRYDGDDKVTANTLVVIVTDEGDGSRRSPTSDSDVENYIAAFAAFPQLVRFAVIGPAYHDRDGSCLGGAQTWGVERYQAVVSATRGRYIDLTAIDGDCTPTEWGENLKQLGELLNNLQTVFPLQTIPDVASIRVYVDDILTPQSEVLDGTVAAGTAIYGDGWSYEASENAVVFNDYDDAAGVSFIPDYNQDVRIIYRPLGGTPRTLPDNF